MQAAKRAVSDFLHHGNKHSVDIQQETNPAVLHETVEEKQHEYLTTAVDREIHQHHHQLHVQPIKDKVVETEQHHNNIIPIEHRTRHHGKDRELSAALEQEHGRFQDEQQILPVETTNSTQTVVGEHVHHHVHDYIQPVIERQRIVPHVVHTTVPIHEHIEHEPFIHKGNVLPTMTMDQFTKSGHSLTGSKKNLEHIEYEGEPLKIDTDSHVGFGSGTTGSIGGGAYTYSHSDKLGSRTSSYSSSDQESQVPRSMSSSKKKSHKSKNSKHKSDYRAESAIDPTRV